MIANNQKGSQRRRQQRQRLKNEQALKRMPHVQNSSPYDEVQNDDQHNPMSNDRDRHHRFAKASHNLRDRPDRNDSSDDNSINLNKNNARPRRWYRGNPYYRGPELSDQSEAENDQAPSEPQINVGHYYNDLEADGYRVVGRRVRQRYIEDHLQERKREDEQDQCYSFDVESFILDHYQDYGGKPYFVNYRINRRYSNGNKYKETFTQLLKHEIISDVNKRLEEKQQEKFQQQIRVRLEKQIYIDQETGIKRIRVYMTAQNRVDRNWLFYFLIKGKMLSLVSDLISEQQPFKISNLRYNINETRLCFIYKQRDHVLVQGIDDLDIDPNRTYYYIHLDSIITFKREAGAIAYLNLQSKIFHQIFRVRMNLEDHITNPNKKCFHNQAIYQEILRKRNVSQSSMIWKIFKKQRGIYLIQGPPGTGKTETIANYSSIQHEYLTKGYYITPESEEEEFSSQKSQKVIMICAQSNAAVNNVARKMLKDGCIGKGYLPNLLRLGHTEEYDEDILSINLPHLCEIQLMKDLKFFSPEYKSSAQLRWTKKLLVQKINKMKIQEEDEDVIAIEKQKLNKIVEAILWVYQTLEENNKSYQAIQQMFLKKSEIVFSTLSTSGKHTFLKFYRTIVKCLIIDQAAQATEPSTLVPFQTGVKKVIFVGDHKQLQPTVMSLNCHYTHYNRSMFERMVLAGKPAELLDTQYRMLSELRQFPNMAFYDNRLKDGIKNMKVPLSLSKLNRASWFFDIKYGLQQKLKKSYQNQAEADAVVYLTIRMLSMGKDLTIGIIAPYKSQIRNLENQFLKMKLSDQKMNRLKISTVDAFQGQERDVIIMTCVKANPDRNIGFVRDWKRMNVSITRAKYLLIVFGNSWTLSVDKVWDSYITHHSQKNSILSVRNHEEAVHYLNTYIIDNS